MVHELQIVRVIGKAGVLDFQDAPNGRYGKKFGMVRLGKRDNPRFLW